MRDEIEKLLKYHCVYDEELLDKLDKLVEEAIDRTIWNVTVGDE